jgi:hypothetical protein
MAFVKRRKGRCSMGRLLAIVVVVIVSISQQCEAQTRNNLLRGLSEIEILIEGLDSQSTECGLTEASIRAAVVPPELGGD